MHDDAPEGYLTQPEIPIALWGRDHWSMLAYLEVRIVDHCGTVDIRNLRADIRINPHRQHMGGDASGYPTRLLDGSTASPHDDWSCIDDLVREGLVEWHGTGLHPVFALTPLGDRVADALRRHKRHGCAFGSFVWP